MEPQEACVMLASVSPDPVHRAMYDVPGDDRPDHLVRLELTRSFR